MNSAGNLDGACIASTMHSGSASACSSPGWSANRPRYERAASVATRAASADTPARWYRAGRLVCKKPQYRSAATGRTPCSNSGAANDSARGVQHASTTDRARFAPADSPAGRRRPHRRRHARRRCTEAAVPAAPAMAANLAEVLRRFGSTYLRDHSLSTPQARAWRAIVTCRTPALGGQLQRCDRLDPTANAPPCRYISTGCGPGPSGCRMSSRSLLPPWQAYSRSSMS